jgi:hypothetical protein
MDIVYKNTVQVPQEFFIKERDQSYSDWKEAFFRELFTNSVDAGATKIIVNISDTQEDKAYRVIEFLDNGSGMDSHVLENVYFHLGRSSRDNSSVGGFGRARILTNFSAAKYEIYTQNWKVEGSGAQYSISTSENFFQGCKQLIYIEKDSTYPGIHNFSNYLKTITTEIEIYINDEKIESNYDKGQYSRDFLVGGVSVGRIYYNENEESRKGDIYIRVNGITMFTHWINVPYCVTIELKPELSRALLISNRDGFKENAQLAFRTFLNEIQGNKTSIKNTFKRVKKKYKGYGVMTAKKGRIPLSENPAFFQSFAFSERMMNRGIRIEQANNALEKFAVDIRSDYNPLSTIPVKDSEETVMVQKGYIIPISTMLPDMIFTVDTDNVDLIREAESYNPEYWKIRLIGNKTEWGVWKKHYNLLMTWRIICEIIVDIAIKNNIFVTEFRWSIGWVFRNDTEALHSVEDNVHFYSLSPISSENGKVKFDVHKTYSIRKLIALARHEIAHTYRNYHDEDFANTLTDLDCLGGERRIYKAVREFLSCK